MPATRWLLCAVLLLLVGSPGVATAQATAAPQAPPGIPSGLAVAPGDGSAVVSWVAPDEGGSPISAYTVTARPGAQVTRVPGVARSATVIGLTNGEAYRFTVVASNRAGPGPPSAVSGSVTPSAAPAPAGPTLLSDDFATDAGGMEVVSVGTWGVAAGRYVLSAPDDRGADVANANLAVHRTVLDGDYTLTALAATAPTASPFNDFSVVFDYQDPANYYFASFSEGNDAATSGIFKVEAGERTELADIATPVVAGTVYPVRVERQGADIRVYRGADQVGATSDISFVGGRVGFGSRNDAATFDDLLVTGPLPGPPPPPAPPAGLLARAWAWLTSPFSATGTDGPSPRP